MSTSCLVEPQKLARMSVRPRPLAADLGWLADAVPLLPEADQPLARMLFVQGHSYRTAAARLGLPASTVSRHALRLRRLLADPLVRNLAAPACPLPRQLHRIAVAAFVHGQGARRIARERQLPLGRVREAISYIRGWSRGRDEGLTAATRSEWEDEA